MNFLSQRVSAVIAYDANMTWHPDDGYRSATVSKGLKKVQDAGDKGDVGCWHVDFEGLGNCEGVTDHSYGAVASF